MIHPEYRLHRNDPKVRTAAAAYRETYRTHMDGTAAGGRLCKLAEYALNEAVETAVSPK